MKTRFAIALLAVAVLCTCVMAQENTASGWYKRGVELAGNGSYEDAVKAYEKAIELDPNYGAAWKDKGYSLGSLATVNKDFGRYNESLVAFDRAIYLIPSNDTRNLALAWDGKANTLISMSYALGDMGKQEEAKSKREEAVNDYSKAIELDPSFTGLEAQLYRAGVLAELNRYDEAVAAYDKIIETVPANDTMTMYAAQVWAGKGNVLEKMGPHNEALKAFDKALEMDPSNMAAMQGRGLALNAMGRSSEANTSFAKAKELGALNGTFAQDKTADEWSKKGQDLDRNGSYEEAVFAYNRAIELEPNNATLYIAKVPSLNMLAFITNSQSKRNESLEAIEKALQIDTKNPSAWELKGSVLSQMKKYSESLEAFDNAIENIGSYSQDSQLNQTEFLSYIWTSKSISLWQMMRYNESLQAVDEAVRIDPAGNYDAWAFEGELLASLGRYNESLRAFDGAAAIGTASSSPEIAALPWAAEGYVLMQMGRYEEADLLYKKIIGLNITGEGADRRLANAWRGRGNALAKLGEYNESLQAFDKSIELNEYNAPYAWTCKGDALWSSGRYDEAVKAFDRALELYPMHADAGIARAQTGRGDSLTKLGKREEALAAYGAAVVASDKAITAFNNATPLDKAVSFTFDPYPLDQKFWIDRGSALKALGREEEAKDAYENALDSANKSLLQSPQDFNAHDAKGKILFELSRYDESIQVYDQFIKADPGSETSATALVWKGKLLFEMGRANESLNSLSRAVVVDPESAEAWRWKAGIAAELGMYEEALVAYNETLRLGWQAENAEIWQEKGGVLKALGRQGEADAAFAKAKELGYQR